jgi:hypothetical protein
MYAYCNFSRNHRVESTSSIKRKFNPSHKKAIPVFICVFGRKELSFSMKTQVIAAYKWCKEKLKIKKRKLGRGATFFACLTK